MLIPVVVRIIMMIIQQSPKKIAELFLWKLMKVRKLGFFMGLTSCSPIAWTSNVSSSIPDKDCDDDDLFWQTDTTSLELRPPQTRCGMDWPALSKHSWCTSYSKQWIYTIHCILSRESLPGQSKRGSYQMISFYKLRTLTLQEQETYLQLDLEHTLQLVLVWFAGTDMTWDTFNQLAPSGNREDNLGQIEMKVFL